MRLLIATPLLAPDIGGPATYVKILLNELPRHGVEIDIAFFGEVRHRSKVVRHLAYFWLIFKKARGVDIVYALDPVSVGFPARLAAFLMGKKFMVRIAGDYAWEQGTQRFGVSDTLDDFSKRSGYGLQVSILKFVQFIVASSSEVIIVPSNYFKSIIVNWGVHEGKIKVIYSVFELKDEIKGKQVCRDLFGIHGIILLTAGRLVPWKGFPMLIELISGLKNKYLESTLLIAGDGPMRKDLEALVLKYGLEDHVKFLGNVAKDKLAHYVSASDVFLLNTSYEGFSHQLLEVMAIGTPIITTPVGGNVELIKDEISGLFAPFDDKTVWLEKIEMILGDPAFGEKLVRGAKKEIANFTVEKMVEDLLAEFAKVEHKAQ